MHEVTGDLLTVLKFSPSIPGEGSVVFVTDDLTQVEPCAHGVNFVTEKGDLLLARH